MPLTDDEHLDLQDSLMRTDLSLKERRSFWETPRNIVLIVGAVAAIAGVLEFKLGQTTPAPQVIIIQQPVPAAK
jgi:hypothetical protein